MNVKSYSAYVSDIQEIMLRSNFGLIIAKFSIA